MRFVSLPILLLSPALVFAELSGESSGKPSSKPSSKPSGEARDDLGKAAASSNGDTLSKQVERWITQGISAQQVDEVSSTISNCAGALMSDECVGAADSPVIESDITLTDEASSAAGSPKVADAEAKKVATTADQVGGPKPATPKSSDPVARQAANTWLNVAQAAQKNIAICDAKTLDYSCYNQAWAAYGKALHSRLPDAFERATKSKELQPALKLHNELATHVRLKWRTPLEKRADVVGIIKQSREWLKACETAENAAKCLSDAAQKIETLSGTVPLGQLNEDQRVALGEILADAYRYSH